MKSESIVIRNNPIFKIVLNENQFEILNSADQNINGIYSYALTDNIEFKKERTNWAITILSFLVEFFSGTAIGAGGRYKERNKLNLIYKGKRFEILLTDCNIEKTIRTIDKIKERLT